jgi:(p)ppGpp synthase/HD superfamily hydrolase
MESRWSQELYIRAYKYAARAHHGQCVPGSDLPYITHLSFVSMEIMSSLSVGNKRNGDLAVQCALLHDTLEDTGVTYEQVKEKFGIVVACGVQALTKNIKLDKNKQMEDSLRRIKKQPKEIWMVKMADRITCCASLLVRASAAAVLAVRLTLLLGRALIKNYLFRRCV